MRLPLSILVATLCACAPSDHDVPRQMGRDPRGAPVVSSDTADIVVHTAGESHRGSPRHWKLQARRYLGDSTDFARISAIRRVGGTLIVTDRLMSPHVAFIDLASGAVTSHFGRHGDGPQEFRDPDWLVADSSGHAVWIYDFDRRGNVLVDFGNPAEPRVRDRRSLNVGVSIESPFAVGDTIVTTGVFLDYTALVMDSAGTVVRRVASPPAFDANDIPHSTGRRFLNRDFMALAPGRERFALFFQWRNRIELFRTRGPTRYASASGPQDTKAVFFVDGYDRFHWGDDAEMAYVGGAASDRYVCGLFCGCRGSAEPRHVHVFTWTGEFVADLEGATISQSLRSGN